MITFETSAAVVGAYGVGLGKMHMWRCIGGFAQIEAGVGSVGLLAADSWRRAKEEGAAVTGRPLVSTPLVANAYRSNINRLLKLL